MAGPVLVLRSTNNSQYDWFSYVDNIKVKRGRNNRIIKLKNSSIQCGERCNNNRCVICPKIQFRNKIRSSITNDEYYTNKDVTANCLSKGVIYLITCNTCLKQYVGETKNLKQRMNQHRTSFKNNKLDTYLSKHYKLANHDHENFSIDILDNIENTDKRTRLDKENKWIRLLCTAYPLGLNDQIQSYGNISQNTDPFAKNTQPYFNYKMHRKYKCHGKRKRKGKINTGNNNIAAIIQNIVSKEGHELYNQYRSLNKVNIRNIMDICYGRSDNNFNLTSDNILKIKSLFANNYWNAYHKNNKLEENLINIKMEYKDDIMDKLNIQRIFNNTEIRKYLRNNLQNTQPPRARIIYKYNTTFSTLLFNYNKVLQKLTYNDMLEIINNPCKCNKNDIYYYKPLGHVLTGDVNIIRNDKIRKLMDYGCKYRMTERTYSKEIKNEIIKGQKDYINILTKKYKLNNNHANNLGKIFKKLNKEKIIPKLHNINKYAIELNRDDYNYIKQLKNRYVITPLDKANNNYGIICKKLYIETINKELGIKPNNVIYPIIGNNTYQLSNYTKEHILKRHEKINENFKLQNKDDKQTIPYIYANPKLHKNPYKFRFITGAYNSSIKELSVELHKILQFVKEHFKRYCSVIQQRTGITCYWSITNSMEVINTLKNRKNTDSNIYTADFNSLFTNLPHDIIKYNIFELIKLCFHNANKTYINVGYNRVFYSNEILKNWRSYTIQDIFYIIETILGNSFAYYSGYIFQQKLGIPQGNNASPDIADLTLSYMEYEFLKNYKSNMFNNTFRYVDDILYIGKNIELFKNSTNLIYHNSLTLESTNIDDKHGHFLDLDIECLEKNINIKLYNKTDDFNFKVRRFPHNNSCMAFNTKINTIKGEIIRISRICSQKKDMLDRITRLFEIFKGNDYDVTELQNIIRHEITRRPEITNKFNINNLEFNKIFD